MKLSIIFLATLVFAKKFTISGFDSGAWAAVQVQIAFSQDVSGAAIIGGGAYGCAKSFGQASCRQQPWNTDPIALYDTYIGTANNLNIDDISNAADHKVWLFSGLLDIQVYPQAMQNLKEFYSIFLKQENILTNFTVAAGHGFPVENYNIPCAYSGAPNIISCGMDTAGDILKFFYGSLKPNSTANLKHLYTFDQTIYVNETDFRVSSLAELGYVYVPESCRSDDCDVHVMLHGCNQNYDLTQGYIVQETGYLGWAETNDIIVIFPQLATVNVDNNPYSCWDWWGYTGSNYLVKEGIQNKAIYRMATELPKKFESALSLAASLVLMIFSSLLL